MYNSIFISDLHGNISLYEKLFDYLRINKPDILFIGGDLLPAGNGYYKGVINKQLNFLSEYLIVQFQKLKDNLKNEYPKVLLILGNDDARIDEQFIFEGEKLGLWKYINQKFVELNEFKIYGYNFVPPTPFQLKDWEKYDVSRFVDTGCISPEAGKRTIEVSKSEVKFSTIKDDLEKLCDEEELNNAIFLFHAPPHKTKLDRAALDGKIIDHVPFRCKRGQHCNKKIY
jgi:Icc-related predicted phosphoesterase